MDVDISQFIALIARGLLIPLFLLMTISFWRKYKSNHSKYFFGYIIFFFLLFFTQSLVFLSDLFLAFSIQGDIPTITNIRFTNYDENRIILVNYLSNLGFNYDLAYWITNFIRPTYLIIYLIVMIAVGSQIQPLEIINKQKHLYLSSFMFLLIPFIVVIFIPQITFSLYSSILVVLGLLTVLFGFFYNILMNLYLVVKSPGELRTRSLFVLTGFILLVGGLVITMRVGLVKSFLPNEGTFWDVPVGVLVSMLGLYCYTRGFRSIKIE
jgi:hypothetical protein